MAVKKYFSTINKDSLNNRNEFVDNASRDSTYYVFDRTETVYIRLLGSKGDKVYIDGEIGDYEVRVNSHKSIYLKSDDQYIRITLASATSSSSAKATLYFLDGAYTLSGTSGKIKLGGKSIPKTYVDLTSKLAANSNTAAANYFDNYDRSVDLADSDEGGSEDGVEGLLQLGGTNDTLRVDREDIGSDDTIDLKGGYNRLELVYGYLDSDVVGGADLEAVGDINYLGDLDELSIENEVLLTAATDIELTMPGEAGQVGLIEFVDVEVDNAHASGANLTISGTSDELTIFSWNDFDLRSGMLTVEGVDELTVFASDGGIDFNIGSDLESLVADGGEGVNVRISERNDDEVEVGEVYIYSYGSSGQLKIEYNDDSLIQVGSLEIESYSDSDLEINNNVESTIEVGWGDGVVRELIKLDSSSDADVFIAGNDRSIIRLGNVDIDGDGEDILSVSVYENEDTDVDIGTVEITGSDNSDVWISISDNEDTDVSIGAVTLNSENGNAEVWIYANVTDDDDGPDQLPPGSVIEIESIDATAGNNAMLAIHSNEDRTNSSDVQVNIGDVTLDAGGDAGVLIGTEDYRGEDGSYAGIVFSDEGGNYDSTIELGDITATAGIGGEDADAAAMLAIMNNEGGKYFGEDDVSITVGDVELTSNGGGEDAIAMALISSNEQAAITIGDMTLEGSKTFTTIWGNSDAEIEIGALSQTSSGEELSWNTGYADLYISYNSDSAIIIDSVSLKSEQGGVWFAVSDNDDSTIAITGDVTLTAGTVTLGEDGEVSAVTGGAYVGIDGEDNSHTDIFIGASIEGEDVVRSEVQLLGTGRAGIEFYNNDATDIVMGNLTLWSQSSDVDVYYEYNHASGEDQFAIDVGNVDAYAYGNVDFYVSDNEGGIYDSSIQFGDVTLTAGDTVNVGINYNDSVDAVFGEFDINAGEDVNFTAINGEDSSLELGDITIVAGSDADVEIIDVSGTQVIDITASDDSYVTIEDAYDLHTLRVTGSEAQVYLYNEMGGNSDDSDSFLLDLSGMTDTFYYGADEWADGDLGEGSYDGTYVENWQAEFDGVVKVHVGIGDMIYNAAHSTWDLNRGWGEGWNGEDWNGDHGWYSLNADGEDYLEATPQVQVLTFAGWDVRDQMNGVIDLQIGGQTYQITVYTDDAWGGEDSSYGAYSGTGDLGSTGISYTVSGVYDGDDGGYGVGNINITLTGPADGSAFTLSGITDLSGHFDARFVSNNITEVAQKASDGIGQEAREIFSFTEDDIGEIVIGGFRPVGYGDGSCASDLIDFSAFALNDEGVGAIRNIGDICISVDNTDGYFSDIIIDFVNQEYGSIRLVGVGQYDDASTGINEAVLAVQSSIIFA